MEVSDNIFFFAGSSFFRRSAFGPWTIFPGRFFFIKKFAKIIRQINCREDQICISQLRFKDLVRKFSKGIRYHLQRAFLPMRRGFATKFNPL